MKILLIGGYRFLGRALIDAASEAGHDVTAFNRGKRWPKGLEGVELIAGDRRANVDELNGREWDVAIDTSGYSPADVECSTSALKQRVGQYIFISSISVYPWPISSGVDEYGGVTPLAADADPNGTDMAMYGARKALCEKVVMDAMRSRSLVLRPGMLVGPHDYTDRFTYWVERAAAGGAFLAPGNASRRIMLIDVRDIASWILFLAERGISGIFNTSGPSTPLTWRAMLQACLDGTGGVGEPVWGDDDSLLSFGLTPGVELPYWVAASENGIFEVDLTRAFGSGLSCRPLVETVRDVHAWIRTRSPERSSMLDREKESTILRSLSSTHP